MNETLDTANYAAPPRTFGKAIKVCFSENRTFRGRASRSELWWFYQFAFLCYSGTLFVSGFMSEYASYSDPDTSSAYKVIPFFVSLVFLIPSLAVGARRLHDINRSGWWQLLYIVPIAPVRSFGSTLLPYDELIYIFEPILIVPLGQWLLLLIIGKLVLIYWWVQKGKPEKNKYDADEDSK